MHPIFSTLIQRPELLLEHLSAYAALLQQETASASAGFLSRWVAWLLAAALGLIFVLLAGVAVMLGVLQKEFHWVLVAVPGTALVLMLIALLKANSALAQSNFSELKAQLANDVAAFKTAPQR